ncbi:MAG: hypothetical protein RLZZ241_2366 [Bacteroidota bacterium]|jgi:ATP-dependent exoDNAse (exonuclease V) beta subunit
MNRTERQFRIFNASAGSGKTYTLTREYLKLLLLPGSGQAFREILAITFTNKAVGELKSRILESLEHFAKSPAAKDTSPLFEEVRKSLNLTFEQLKARATKVLQELLHNYAFFDVSTIDKFYYRVIRTFARDLNLPAHFEVLMDYDIVLQKAVDALVQKAGDNPELTKVLIAFALEKSSEDKSWDIQHELFRMGKMLFDETHYSILSSLKDKNMQDFVALRHRLQAEIKVLEKNLLQLAQSLMDLFDQNGLERSDFKGGFFHKFILEFTLGKFETDFDSVWKQRFGTEPLYPARAPESSKAVLDALLPQLADHFIQIREWVNRRNFYVNALSNMGPFTVLGLLELEVAQILKTESLVPISHFNALVAKELKDQPAPYIYERLGEKYRHYFIDEFQDTSELQWNNLIPLIANALEGEDLSGKRGSLVLVGDAKQAIYRWRGGKAEQLLQLATENSPFVFLPEVRDLPKNFRSREQIVAFNNSFFKHISQHLGNPEYETLYRDGSAQEVEPSKSGLVQIEFISPDSESQELPYLKRCEELINSATEMGFNFKDICILTRKRQSGVLVSNHLLKAGIPIVSSETLLLKHNSSVSFLVALLTFIANPGDQHAQFEILEHLAPNGPDQHSWIADKLQRLEHYLLTDYDFNCASNSRMPVYDILERSILKFGLTGKDDAYLIFLLDLALEIGNIQNTGIGAFLKYWNLKQNSLSVAAPEGLDAVRLMTIHKSKGLEFPIVIFPFANAEFYNEKNAKLWIPVSGFPFDEFSYLQISKKNEVSQYNESIRDLYLEDREKLELDAFNVLYVAHTRASEALYVLTEANDGNSNNIKSYSDLYAAYLRDMGLWNPNQYQYVFGHNIVSMTSESKDTPGRLKLHLNASEKKKCNLVTRNSALWGSPQEAAQKHGTFLHYGLSMIHSAEDIQKVSEHLILEGLMPAEDTAHFISLCNTIVTHPQLFSFFTPGWEVLTERDIISKNGLILRPDRLLIRDKKAVLLDYKTGQPKSADKFQLQGYAEAVEDLGLNVEQALLIYISEDRITLEFI